MEKQTISLENYEEIISDVSINKLPKVLQKGHHFFLDAQKFYTIEPDIKDAIDMYLDKLNMHLFGSSTIEHPISVTEIDFISRFVQMHRTVQSKKALKEYISGLHNAIAKKSINKNSATAEQIAKIQRKLIDLYNDQLFKSELRIVINRKWLKQLRALIPDTLEGITRDDKKVVINPMAQTRLKKASSLFSPINQQVKTNQNNTFRLPGALGELLGDIERFELAITIEGDQGGGKTRFTYQLADAFASLGNRIAIFSLEIGSRSDLISRMKQEYLQSQHQRTIFIADQLPDGFKTIASAASTFDVIIIDSWNKTGLPSQDFDKLRKENPNTIFIVIFQRTTQKTIRGGTAPLFDAGINIEVVKADDSFKNNYAVTSKNRYGITGIKYNIFNKEIINTEAVISETF